MDKIITVSINELLLGILLVVAIIAVIVLICVLAKANKTLKKVDGILDDTSVVTGFAAKQTQKVDDIVTGVEEAVSTCVDNIKSSNGIIKAAAGIVNAATSIFGLLKNSDKKEEIEETEKTEEK